jgi:hypothetical protein
MEKKEYIVLCNRLLLGKIGSNLDLRNGDKVSLTDVESALLLGRQSIALAKQVDAEEAKTDDIGDIVEAIKTLDKEDENLWTTDGRPQLKALSEAAGRKVSTKERNIAWGEYQDSIDGDSDEPGGDE